jgi:CubicO group peptidase (beta-lactamase class C family)
VAHARVLHPFCWPWSLILSSRIQGCIGETIGHEATIKISALICALLLSTAVAQELAVAKPESVGLSSERLNRIATVVQHNIDEKRIAGAATLVSRRGQVVWLKAQGMADREVGKPMRPDTIFRICSMTKPITSVAVMML